MKEKALKKRKAVKRKEYNIGVSFGEYKHLKKEAEEEALIEKMKNQKFQDEIEEKLSIKFKEASDEV